jgi:hypothetical protein
MGTPMTRDGQDNIADSWAETRVKDRYGRHMPPAHFFLPDHRLNKEGVASDSYLTGKERKRQPGEEVTSCQLPVIGLLLND